MKTPIVLLDSCRVGQVKNVIEVANREMIKQKEFTSQHIAERQRFQALAAEGRSLIEQLRSELKFMVGEQELLKLVNDDFKQRDIQHIYQLNRCAVFMSTARGVLERLASSSSPIAEEVRVLFAEHYAENVDVALQKGTIQMPLEVDDQAAQMMPQTQQFIRSMINSMS